MGTRSGDFSMPKNLPKKLKFLSQSVGEMNQRRPAGTFFSELHHTWTMANCENQYCLLDHFIYLLDKEHSHYFPRSH